MVVKRLLLCWLACDIGIVQSSSEGPPHGVLSPVGCVAGDGQQPLDEAILHQVTMLSVHGHIAESAIHTQ